MLLLRNIFFNQTSFFQKFLNFCISSEEGIMEQLFPSTGHQIIYCNSVICINVLTHKE